MAGVPPKLDAEQSAERTPLPAAGASKSDARVVLAWREWLGALATDAEAALAASMAYKALDDSARDEWLSALEQDAPRLGVPRIAVYAPLLAVETSHERRRRIMDAVGPDDARAAPRVPPRGLVGRGSDGEHVAAVIWPLYLDFVQVLACGFRTERGFSWVRHDPILQDTAAPRGGDSVHGVQLDAVPLKSLIDDLALAVLSHERSGKVLPEALRLFADLFGPLEPLGA
jgi:hypothetical protein